MNRDELQAAILGTAMLFNEEIPNISLLPGDFSGHYRKVFEHLLDNGGDALTVSSAVDVPLSKLSQWISGEFTASFLPGYCERLREENIRLRAIELGGKIRNASTVDDILSLVDAFNADNEAKDKTEPADVKRSISSLMTVLEKRHKNKGKLLGMPTGIPELDKKTDGLHRGDLVVVAGPSSMGKTSLGVGLMEAVCDAGHSALCFSCEMTKEQLLMRSLEGHANVNFGRIRSANFEDADWPKMTNAFEGMSQWKLKIDDPAGIGIQEIKRKVRKAKRDGLDLVLIDYLQILEYDNTKEVSELDRICRTLKNLAKGEDVCIVLLSQLNRRSEYEKRKPTMTDLRGSGAIENHSDVVLFPWRPAANCVKCQEQINNAEHDFVLHQAKAEIIIGKQRQGERNVSIPVVWTGEHVKFRPIARRDDDEY